MQCCLLTFVEEVNKGRSAEKKVPGNFQEKMGCNPCEEITGIRVETGSRNSSWIHLLFSVHVQGKKVRVLCFVVS